MANNYQIESVHDLSKDILTVTEGDRNRFALADVYQLTLKAEGFFPPKPLSLMPSLPSSLRRKVDNSCSACVPPAKMIEYESMAKSTLREYRQSLLQWLETNAPGYSATGTYERPSVSELGSTLKTKDHDKH